MSFNHVSTLFILLRFSEALSITLSKSDLLKIGLYCINSKSAVDIIYYAGFEHNDIKGKIILDLGAGTGRLSIASLYLQAISVLSVDIDFKSLSIRIRF